MRDGVDDLAGREPAWRDAAAAAILLVLQWIAVAQILGTLLAATGGGRFEPVSILAMVMVAGAAALMVGATASSFPFAVLAPDPLLLALVIATTGAAVGGRPGWTGFCVLAAMLLGAALNVMLSWRNLYRILDLVPLPLVAGLMGALGLTGILAGVSLAAGGAIEVTMLADATTAVPAALAATAGLVLHLALRSGRPLLLAALPVLAAAGIAGALWMPPSGAPATGEAALILLTAASRLPNLPELLAALPTIAAIAVLMAVLVRVGVRDLEGSAAWDADPRREFFVGGLVSALVSALTFAPAGLSPALSRPLASLGGKARPFLAATAIAGAVLVLTAGVWLARMPAVVTGAVLIALGLGVIETWLVRTGMRAGLIERLTLFGILVAILVLGPGYGLVLGNAAGVAAFALAYSRAKPVRARFSGDTALSNVDRSPRETEALRARGRERIVLAIQGFLFFGTADQLLGDVRDELKHGAGELCYLILDFGDVSGADSSAVVSFNRIVEETAAAGVTLCLAQMSDDLAGHLLPESIETAGPLRFASLDEALEHAESALLAGEQALPNAGHAFSDGLAREQGADVAARILAVFETDRVPALDTILSQGDRSDDLIFLEKGGASVFLHLAAGGKVRVRRFGSGTMIGEMGFHLSTPRTASVVADLPCTLLRLTRDALHGLENTDPEAALAFHDFVARRLCRRILDKDHLVANLMIVTKRLA